MDTIDSVLAEAQRAWRAYGVPAADRATLAADLRSDLEAAAAEGAAPHELIGGDVGGFARRLADEAGVTRIVPAYGQLLLTALFGGVLAGVAGTLVMMVLWPALTRTFTLDVRVPV